MAKGSGSTRTSSSGNPRGLGVANLSAGGGASISQPAIPQLYDRNDWISRGRENEVKIVPLGISVNDSTAEKDRDILNSVMGQLSDGMWENSPGMEKYWRTMDFSQDDNGNVIIKTVPAYKVKRTRWSRYGSYSWNETKDSGIYYKSNEQMKKWVAGKIRAIVRQEDKDAGIGPWSADNRTALDYLRGVTVADAYSLYKRLMK